MMFGQCTATTTSMCSNIMTIISSKLGEVASPNSPMTSSIYKPPCFWQNLDSPDYPVSHQKRPSPG